MKKKFSQFISILILLFCSCQSSNSPKAVAAVFLNSFSEKKFSEAKKYCTPEAVKLVEIAESLSKTSSTKEEFTGKRYEVLSQETRGQNAIVKYREAGSKDIEEMKLTYTDNQWLVSISKEDVMAKQNPEKDYENVNQKDTSKVF